MVSQAPPTLIQGSIIDDTSRPTDLPNDSGFLRLPHTPGTAKPVGVGVLTEGHTFIVVDCRERAFYKADASTISRR